MRAFSTAAREGSEVDEVKDIMPEKLRVRAFSMAARGEGAVRWRRVDRCCEQGCCQ